MLSSLQTTGTWWLALLNIGMPDVAWVAPASTTPEPPLGPGSVAKLALLDGGSGGPTQHPPLEKRVF